MKPSKTLLSRLPTVNELLERPRIKALLGRVNQMEVTAGVRQYIERARQELSRRSLDAPIPSISELVDRAARYILRSRTTQPRRVINATGQFWPPGLVRPPLAEEAILAATEWMQHYHEANVDDLDRALAEGAGVEGAMACNTSSAALWLTLAAVASKGPVVIARGELGTLDDGTRITDLASALGVEIRAVGATDGVTLDDYRAALTGEMGCVLRVEALPHAHWHGVPRPTVHELAAVCRCEKVCLVHYLHNAPLVPLDEDESADRTTVASSWKSGVDLAVVRGDGHIGGPSCGLVVGKRTYVDALQAHPLARLVRVHPPTAAALAVTMTLLRTPDRPLDCLPLLALRSTPIENLKLRAERMAGQLAGLAPVTAAQPIELPRGEVARGERELASWGVRLEFAPEELARVKQHLATSQPRVEGEWQGDAWLVDLRTMFPGEDMEVVTLVEMLAGERTVTIEVTAEPQENE